jgi:hypothetical protein
LKYRVVEAKVLRQDKGFRVDAWLLIQGVGKAVHFDIESMADLPANLEKHIKAAYLQVTGLALP